MPRGAIWGRFPAWVAALVLLGTALAHAPVAARSPAARCETARLQLAATYERCWFGLLATSRTTAGPIDTDRCDRRLGRAWDRQATRCDATPDVGRVQDLIRDHGSTVATALAGGPLLDCASRLQQCSAALDVCQVGCGAPTSGTLLASAQMRCWNSEGVAVACAGTGHDGDLRRGLARAYSDHRDGTIGDLQTGLMWEKLSDDGSIHDRDTIYTWPEAFARVATLNAEAFAGYTDWRLPNVVELLSLTSYDRNNPTTASVFFVPDCVPGCSVLACSCIRAAPYWTSTTSEAAAAQHVAWVVEFLYGQWQGSQKTSGAHVRAVRGPS